MELRILGPLEVVGDDGQALALRGGQVRAVLARLALDLNEVVSLDQLIDAVWGESPPSAPQGALQVHVHSLRKVLGADRIVTRAPGYLLRMDEGDVDAVRFARLVNEGEQLLHAGDHSGAVAVLQQALDLWRGPALSDHVFEPFAQQEAGRLEELRLVALERRFDADLALGRHAALVPELEALVAAQPLRERFRAQLMLALYRANRQADALEVYREARSILVDGLGIDPGPELRDLEQAILRQDPKLDVPAPGPVGPRLSPSSPLIGRDLEQAAIAGLMRRPETRLVTLTGTGGVGKTRLALAAADEVGRAVFVDLAPLSDPEHVLPEIAVAVGADEASVAAVAGQLEASFAGPPLLVLDNLEHIPEAHPVIADLLAAAPAVRVLATSRIPLRLAVEHEYRVPPLRVPDQGAATPADVRDSDAVRLYVERVRSAIPAFELGDDNAAAVAEICQAVDGLPLAIELAAARIRVLGPSGTAERLGARLALLARNAPDLPHRQRSLRATIDWSYDLLEEDAQDVFRTLGVFAGFVGLDAVEAVHGGDATSGLETLLDAGLVLHMSDAAGEPRFGMLETIREYALGKLVDAGAEADARERHLDHFLFLAESLAEREHEAGPTPELLDAAELELAELRAARAWAELHADPERQLRLVVALRFYFATRGERGEGRQAVEAAVDRADSVPAELRARIVVEAGGAAMDEGDEERAVALFREALPSLEEAGDRVTTGRVLAHIGGSLARLDRLDEAIQHFEQSAALFQEIGDDRRRGHALTQLAEVHERRGEYAVARGHLLVALEILEAQGPSTSLAYTLYMLGCVAWDERNDVEAARWASQALDEILALRFHELLAYELVFVAGLVLDRAPDVAARVLGAAREGFQRAGVAIQSGEEARATEMEAALLSELGKQQFHELAGAGALLTVPEAVALANEALTHVVGTPASSP
jgi:predicted ATPase/DNA-binding SARP family transcriptional activator